MNEIKSTEKPLFEGDILQQKLEDELQRLALNAIAPDVRLRACIALKKEIKDNPPEDEDKSKTINFIDPPTPPSEAPIELPEKFTAPINEEVKEESPALSIPSTITPYKDPRESQIEKPKTWLEATGVKH